MSHCTNYVLRVHGELQVGNTRWGAQGILRNVIFGPERTLTFLVDVLEQARESGLDYPYNEGMVEGAVFADYDARKLLVFGGEDARAERLLQRAYIELLSKAWPGWQVAWAFGGWPEIARAAGLEPELEHHEPRAPLDTVRIAGSVPHAYLYALITVSDGRGVRDYGLADPDIRVVPTGPRLVELLAPHAPLAPSPLFHEARLGLVIDTRERSLAYWTGAATVSWVPVGLAAAWPGYSITKDDRAAIVHFERTGRDASVIDVDPSITRVRLVECELVRVGAGSSAVEWVRQQAAKPGVSIAPGADLMPSSVAGDPAADEAWIAALVSSFA
jgi:hypothetical protein